MREIISRHGHTDKDTMHSYIETYERILEPLRNKPCNLLEIGVFFGGSAYTWHEYLSQSNLFLIDINDVVLPQIKSEVDPTRWHYFIKDAYTPNSVQEIQAMCLDGFDLIIDDGPHSLESQLFTLAYYTPLLKRGGTLIIEDIASSANLRTLCKYARRQPNVTVEVVDLRQNKKRYDDILLIVNKI